MKFIYLLLLIFLTWPCSAKDAFIEYSKTVEKLIRKKGLKTGHLGLSVSLLPSEAGEREMPLYNLNETQLFIPASLVKIVSLSAFYYYFPMDFQFQKPTFLLHPLFQAADSKGLW